MSDFSVVTDIGALIEVQGLQSGSVNANTTAIQARLVTTGLQNLTGWVDVTNSTNGNDWANQSVVVLFTPADLADVESQLSCQLQLKATTSGVDIAILTANIIDVLVVT